MHHIETDISETQWQILNAALKNALREHNETVKVYKSLKLTTPAELAEAEARAQATADLIIQLGV